MKPLIAALLMLTLAVAASAVAPTPEQQAALDKAPSCTGTIISARFVHGLGWQSHTDMMIPVAGDDGKEMVFYLRESSLLADATGKYIAFSDRPDHLKGRKVEVKYAVITDAAGQVAKVENGQKGILLIRFLDWTPGRK